MRSRRRTERFAGRGNAGPFPACEKHAIRAVDKRAGISYNDADNGVALQSAARWLTARVWRK
ncbi:MAG: hypothetical protein K2N94_16275 [Lachnospiraceae bacterium]|nr:hypothetical protein [Lachnospiraceae bacterium]